MLFLFCQPIDPIFFRFLKGRPKINSVLPDVLFLELILCAILVS